MMRSIPYPTYAIAASIAAFAISVPIVLHVLKQPPVLERPASGILGQFSMPSPQTTDRIAAKPGAGTNSPATTPVTRTPIAEAKAKREEERRLTAALTRSQSARTQAEPRRQAAASVAMADEARKGRFRSAVRSSPAHLGYRAVPPIAGLTGTIIMVDPTLPSGSARNRDRFEHVASNPLKQVSEHPVSTFSVDVDTASYAVVRRALNAGHLPRKDAVRVEEMINYFTYGYPRPNSASEPFRTSVSVVANPWNPDTRLLHVGIKGYELDSAERPRANLVLLVDVSGSMRPSGRLPLLQNAFRMLLDKLKPDDTIAIVTYASGSGVVLKPTKVAEKSKIVAAINGLSAGGSTAGAQGIQDAYRQAEANFDKNAVNRVIIGTDGDFNVGITNRDELKGYIERKRKSGIYLSILGVGRGNYNDALMQTLAQNGNGAAAYIDTLNEARKVLVEEASSTLFPIARDVKIQLEFNPAVVSAYRLIGYETRALRRQDFNNDKVDAGDVGSGHAVTAIYEITPANAKNKLVDDLRYGKPSAAKPATAPQADGKSGELGFLKLRYKLPKAETSRLLTMPIKAGTLAGTPATGSSDVRFAIAVAAFGQLLKGEPWTKNLSYDDVITLANANKGADPFGLRAEFVNLVRLAKSAQP